MTASVQNSRSSLKVLKNGLKWFREATDETPEDRVWMVETLVDSLEKCLDSLSAQIRFYHSAKSPTRALAVIHPDGSQEYVHGAAVEALHLPQPGKCEDAVIYGKPEALAAIAAILQSAGQPASGPAPLHDLSQRLATIAGQHSAAPASNNQCLAETGECPPESLDAFWGAHVTADENATLHHRDLFKTYLQWSERTRQPVLSESAFIRTIQERVEKMTVNGRLVYAGVRLSSQ